MREKVLCTHNMKTGSRESHTHLLIYIGVIEALLSILLRDDLVTFTIDPVHDFYVSFLHSSDSFFSLCHSHTFKLNKYIPWSTKNEEERQKEKFKLHERSTLVHLIQSTDMRLHTYTFTKTCQ